MFFNTQPNPAITLDNRWSRGADMLVGRKPTGLVELKEDFDGIYLLFDEKQPNSLTRNYKESGIYDGIASSTWSWQNDEVGPCLEVNARYGLEVGDWRRMAREAKPKGYCYFVDFKIVSNSGTLQVFEMGGATDSGTCFCTNINKNVNFLSSGSFSASSSNDFWTDGDRIRTGFVYDGGTTTQAFFYNVTTRAFSSFTDTSCTPVSSNGANVELGTNFETMRLYCFMGTNNPIPVELLRSLVVDGPYQLLKPAGN